MHVSILTTHRQLTLVIAVAAFALGAAGGLLLALGAA